MRLFGTIALLCTLLACGRGEEEKKGPTPVPGTPVSGTAPAAPAPSAGTPALPVGLPDLDPRPTPAPLVISTPESCDPCSLLMEFDYDDLRGGRACELCGGETLACEGWPEPGTPSCDQLDWLRNCIYARLGYDFATAQEWRVTFEQEPWYVPDPKFTWNRVNPVQKRNAEELRLLVKKKRCAR